MEQAVQIRGLRYCYRGQGRPALRGIDLQIGQGEFAVLAGRAGSGKSTICYALSGLAPHSFGGTMEGQVVVCGTDTRQATVAEMARRVGTVLQNAESQLVGLSVEEDAAFALENAGLPAAEIAARVEWALRAVRMEALAGASPWHLSGGQRQRLAVAAAIALRPAVLVLDNPTAELDPLGKMELMETVASLNREHGVTVVMVNQELEEVIRYASRLILLDDGRIVAAGSPAEVMADPDRVRGAGVRLPQVTEAADRLSRRGCWTGPLPLSVESAVEQFRLRPSNGHSTFHLGRLASVPRAPLVVMDDVSFGYPGGPPILKDVSLTVRRGEFVTLMGPNGAGKTTLAKHFNGLLTPTSGSVQVAGLDTRAGSASTLASHAGYVFQNPDHQIFSSSVAEELAFGPKNLGWPPERIEEAVRKAIASLGPGRAGGDDPFFMGLAERKLLAIASVLIMQPELLVLDEPATGADHDASLRIMRYLAELHAQGLTIVIVTHDVSLAADYADRLIVIEGGSIVLDGPPREIFQQPERLGQCLVTPPQVASLARELRRTCPHLPPDICRIGELVEWFGGQG